ncbi:S8 family peptidase [Chryseobacterium scophthalmum]|uniref:Por secretion system C-terminal sorting domain-containing protein n=1 Tax=Chryseobacterium scophthalmum TaxID=59733 RepID=A0A1N6ENU7_9FLAO|nr:S8/S53 family peptidase [Chryseobacterium scophthalmum]SIN84769.1 Por secretion system C-terminal sorting domain-containing protein [Chryseobacterium scophthalmum]
MKNKILPFLLLAESFLFAQNKLCYIQIPNENNVPKISIENGKSTVSHFDVNLTKALSKYNIFTFKKAFPTSVTPFLQTVYILEVDKAGIIDDLKKYTTYFPLIEETYKPELLYTPNDYNYPGTTSPLQSLDLINIREAWDYTHGDPNFMIGISDTPISTTHEDLVGKVTSLISYTIPDSHGTAVASHAAANTDNNKGIPGTGFNSKILYNSFGINSLLELSQNGARVVNASWTNTCNYSEIDQLVIDEIHNNGTVIVVAAGNGFAGANGGTCGGPNNYVYPASYNHVISISSVGHADVGYTYNNIPMLWRDRVEQLIGDPNSTHQNNDMVDLRVAGFNVVGATAVSDSSYGGAWGTSLAAPQVAGVVALLFSVNNCLNPNEIESILKLTSANLDDIPENQPYIGKLGAGRIDAGKATKIAWQMNPSNGGEVLIKDRNFDKWDFELLNSAESIKIQNESFTQNANVIFKAKKSITLDAGTLLQPNSGKSHYMYVEDINTCSPFNRVANSFNVEKKSSNEDVLKQQKIVNEDISIYPIPTKNKIFIKSKKDLINSKIKVFDINNRLVLQKNVESTNENTFSIDLSSLLKGVYFLEVSNSNLNYRKKIIKD